MSGDDPTSDPDRLARIERALAEYLLAADARAAPDTAGWLAGYADLQPELGELLAAEAGLRRLADPLRAAAGQAAAQDDIPPGPGECHADEVATMDGPSDPATPLSRQPDDPGVTTDAIDPDAPTIDGHPEANPVPLCGGARVRYFGDYEIRRELGRGGMGVVFEARQISLNRPVALKMIRAGVLADEAELRRFQNEAEAVALLDHPGIVPVHEVGEHGGQRYFSMKLVPGDSLAGRLGRYRGDPRVAAGLVAELAEAVHHAHVRGILHRDLKPANILIDEQGHPHVTDFGLAKRVEGDAELTQSGAILGTPAYMAPEQATGHRASITTATDVYGLGAVLYALLSGRAPFGGDSAIETLDAVRTRPPVPPSRFDSRIPLDLEVICLKCLEKDPARRYRSADAMGEDLRRWLDGRPIAARLVGSITRAWKWCRRHPLPAVLAASLVLAVLAGSVASTALWLRAERNYRNEQEARTEALARLGLALEAIRTYYTGVSEDVMLKEPQMRSLRDKLLGTALEFYKRLQQSLEGNPDPKAQADLADSYYKVAAITSQVSSNKDAEQAMRQALAIWVRLAAAAPANDDYQRTLADCLFQVGERQRALTIQERLAAAHPEVMRDQISLAWSLANPVTLDASNEAVVQELRRNEQRLERFIVIHPDVPEFRRAVASVCNWLAMYQAKQVEYEASLDSLRRGQRALEGMTTTPTHYDRHLLSRILDNVTDNLVVLGRWEEAIASRRKALELSEGVVANHPVYTIYRVFLAINLRGLADLQRRAGSLAEAEVALRRARKILTELPQEPNVQEDLALTDVSLGRVEAALGRRDEAALGRRDKAAEHLRQAVRTLEEQVVHFNDVGADPPIRVVVRQFIDACDALIEIRGSTNPLLDARAHFVRLVREGRLKPTTRQVLLWLDIRIAKAQQQSGQTTESLESIGRNPLPAPLSLLSRNDFGH